MNVSLFSDRQDYRMVLWTSATTRETLLAGLMTIAELLQLPQKEEHDHTQVIGAVKQWLASRGFIER